MKRRPNKIRKITRKNLPFGLFQYEVTFTTPKNLIESDLISVHSSIKKTKYYKKPKHNHIRGASRDTVLELDNLVIHAESMFIGKYKLDIRERKYPVKLYLTNEEDITMLYFFHFDKHIKHIRKITTDDGVIFDTLGIDDLPHINHHWMVETEQSHKNGVNIDGRLYLQNHADASSVSKKLGLPVHHLIKET